MEYQSEIRDSVINELFEKVSNKNYRKYLVKLTLNPIRGFQNETIKFDFPVTALIGPNGGAKTTVLGAAACAYISEKPGRFFTKSGSLDNSMQNWKILYELIDRDISPKDSVNKSCRFKSLKWYRDNMSRDVSVFGVSRTVPATERAELRKCASTVFKFWASQEESFDEMVISSASKVLGKEIREYSQIKVGTDGKVTLLKGSTDSGISYSEFHFGAGESSIIRIIMKMESLEENSLILIEEIENGLHPIATQRMVEYLIEFSKRKKSQVIFTTHSNDALLPLPPKAIWAAINNTLFQGKLNVKSLRTITGQVEASLAIFVEDEFARMWIETILSDDINIIENSIEIHAMAGDGTAVAINKYHNNDPSIRFKSICIIDGDSRQEESSENKVYRLPGQCPEKYIYDKVLELISNSNDTKIGELSLLLQKKFEDSSFVEQKIRQIGLTCRDHHLLFSQIGKSIGFISETVVKGAFLHLWSRYCTEESGNILSIIKENIPNN